MFRLKVENVATPLAAATVLIPARVPLAGLVPIASVMLVVAVVTVLPWASWTATCTAGVFTAPATALLGCTVKTTFAAAPVWTGPTLLLAHPPSATPQTATPSQNPPRANTPARRLLSVPPALPVLSPAPRRGGSDGSSCCWARGSWWSIGFLLSLLAVLGVTALGAVAGLVRCRARLKRRARPRRRPAWSCW